MAIEILGWGAQVARLLRAQRTERGALALASPEVRFEIDTETHDPLDVGMYQVSKPDLGPCFSHSTRRAPAPCMACCHRPPHMRAQQSALCEGFVRPESLGC